MNGPVGLLFVTLSSVLVVGVAACAGAATSPTTEGTAAGTEVQATAVSATATTAASTTATVASTATTEEPPATWMILNPGGDLPSPRGGHAMVYDSGSGRVILFGGSGDGTTGLDDTWAYDPVANAWSDLSPNGTVPSGRTYHAMVYDSGSDRVILFGGGVGHVPRNDTWAYDPAANTWTNLKPTGRLPSPRLAHSMVYDSAGGRVILFGGYDGSAELNDTWAYDPAANTWTDLKPSGDLPPPRFAQSMVYDSAANRVILFGGYDGSVDINDTWAYDPTTNVWTNLEPSGSLPSGRGFHSMVYDSAGGRTVLFGGYDGTNGFDDTWAYESVANAWTDLSPTGALPRARTGHAMVYDSDTGLVVLFGGAVDVTFDDIWAFGSRP